MNTTAVPLSVFTAASGTRIDGRTGVGGRTAAVLRFGDEEIDLGAHLGENARIVIGDRDLHLHRGALAIGGRHDLARDPAKARVGIRVERDARRLPFVIRPMYASFTSTSTSSVSRSAIVTTAPRVSPPPTEGATTSPTSASLRSTVPVNGARMIVLSFVASRQLQRRLGALLSRRCRVMRASAWAARLVADS